MICAHAVSPRLAGGRPRRLSDDTLLCRHKAKYRVGELIRVSRAKSTFEKGYEAGWSEEIFRIHRVLKWRKPLVYELSDLAGEIIDGIFYEQELVDKNLQEEEFIIDRVIRSKGRGVNKQCLVS